LNLTDWRREIGSRKTSVSILSQLLIKINSLLVELIVFVSMLHIPSGLVYSGLNFLLDGVGFGSVHLLEALETLLHLQQQLGGLIVQNFHARQFD